MLEVLLAAFVGALISLDRTAFLQIMISQPLVAGTVVGFSLGDAVTGLTIGSVLELLWIGAVPVGSSVPPNETSAAVIATSVSIIAGRHTGSVNALPMHLMVLSILLAIPLAMIGQRIDISVRGYNRRFVLNADRLLASGDLSRIGGENLKGLLSFFAASFLSLMALIGFGIVATEAIYPILPLPFARGFIFSFYLLIALGIAVSVRTAKGKRIVPLFAAGFLLGTVFIYLLG